MLSLGYTSSYLQACAASQETQGVKKPGSEDTRWVVEGLKVDF